MVASGCPSARQLQDYTFPDLEKCAIRESLGVRVRRTDLVYLILRGFWSTRWDSNLYFSDHCINSKIIYVHAQHSVWLTVAVSEVVQ